VRTENQKEINRKSFQRFKRFKQRHPEKVKEWSNRNHRNRLYKNKYGITADAFDQQIVEQNNMCPIGPHVFGPVGHSGDSPCLDHCHETGEIRMVICRNHNVLLGMCHDSIDVLHSAIEYLMKFRAVAKKSRSMEEILPD
jgi:hypothetical protein